MNLKLDRSSDEDYIPSSVVVGDIAMSLGNNRTSKAKRLSNCRNAASGSTGGQVPNVSNCGTVLYSGSATQDILDALAEYEAGDVPLRLSHLNSSVTGENAINVEQSAQVVHVSMLTVENRIGHLEY